MTAAAAEKLPMIHRRIDAGPALSRREMVRRLLAGLSACATSPLVATSHPIYALFRKEAVLDEAEALGTADWKPAFLNTKENETLIALAEAIVPGTTKAEANRFIDLLLSVDKPENQHRFVESLTAFEAEAQAQFGRNFASLDDSQKNSLLTDASKNPNPVGTSLHAHFENVKGWVAGAYYSSEAGMRELGWAGDYVFEEFPGCEHLEGHH